MRSLQSSWPHFFFPPPPAAAAKTATEEVERVEEPPKNVRRRMDARVARVFFVVRISRIAHELLECCVQSCRKVFLERVRVGKNKKREAGKRECIEKEKAERQRRLDAQLPMTSARPASHFPLSISRYHALALTSKASSWHTPRRAAWLVNVENRVFVFLSVFFFLKKK